MNKLRCFYSSNNVLVNYTGSNINTLLEFCLDCKTSEREEKTDLVVAKQIADTLIDLFGYIFTVENCETLHTLQRKKTRM